MQNKSFQDLVDVFNSNALTSASNQDKMGLLALRYALLTRHKSTGVDDAEKTALAQTMLDATIKFAEKVLDHILQQSSSVQGLEDFRDLPESVETINGWVEAPLTALTAPESIAYLPKGASETLADIALQAIDAMSSKPDGFKFHQYAHKTMGQITQTILTHADMIADHAKANELTVDHLATKQPIVARKPILLKSKSPVPTT